MSPHRTTARRNFAPSCRSRTDPTIHPEDAGFDTFRRQRTVCVAVHTLAAWGSLEVILPLISGDPRIALVYTQVPDQLGAGVSAAVAAYGASAMPWERAKNVGADLAIGASLHRMEELPARRRVAFPHGAGYNKRWQRWNWMGPEAVPPTYGLDRESLLHDGVPVFDALLLTHEDQRDILHRQCPEAEHAAFVGGDVIYDSLLAIRSPRTTRRRVRREFGMWPGQRLVLLASTFGADSMLSNYLTDLPRLIAELPARYRAVLALHSAVWSHHGRRYVLDCLRPALDAGLRLVEAGEDWRGLLPAADALVSDATSMGLYGATLGLPLLMTDLPAYVLDPSSAIAELAAKSPKLKPKTPLLGQLDAAREAQPIQSAIARRRVSSAPGRAATLLRTKLYELMELPEPTWQPALSTIQMPVSAQW